MPLFPKNPNEAMYSGGRKHFTDVIKNRVENDTLIFKNPEEDFNNGSTLVVEPGEQAIFINEGRIEEKFNPGTYTLSTENYPFISRLRNALSGGVSSFHCVVYFVRTASSREIKWGTDTPIKVYDKALADQFTGLGIETEVRARGSYRVKIDDAGLFLSQLIGGNYNLMQQESLSDFFRNQFLGNIVAIVTQKLSEWDGPLIQASSQSVAYAEILQKQLAPVVSEFGITMTNFNIRLDVVDNEQRRDAMELVNKNREAYYNSMASGAGQAAFAQGQQQAYQTFGTTYQQAQVLGAMNAAASNQGGDAGSLVGAGIGLTMGAGLGQVVPGLMNQTMQSASGSSTEEQDAPGQQSDAVRRLSDLKKMLEADLISDEEYAAKKSDILKSL